MDDASTPGSASDLTARARIRDTALLLFAERGFRGASMREIAEAAGVSLGLVQHHFRSKDGLRQVCDEHALKVFRETKFAAAERGQTISPAFLSATYEHTLPAVRYMARALAESSPGAASLFDELVALTEELLGREEFAPETADLHAYAAVVTAQDLGLLALHAHLSRSLGADVLTRDGQPRLARASLEAYSRPFLSREFADSVLATLDALDRSADGRPPDSPHASATPSSGGKPRRSARRSPRT